MKPALVTSAGSNGGGPAPAVTAEWQTMGIPIPLPASEPAATDDAEPDTETMRIGVAVSIPEPWGTQIEAWRESFGDPQARSIPAHITLLPPTAVARHDVLGVHDHLLRVASTFERFRLDLDGTDTFRPVSPVVFLKVTRGAGACDRLQRTVRTGPLARDLTFPYHPHVTLAHHVDEASLDQALTTLRDFSASWIVHSFWLYEHGADEVWRPKHLYAFG